jgi:DNA helicase-2/ATP-dependent DNA helicase PcrA
VYVDEAQDLSWAQWQAIKYAFSRSTKSVIAGDDDQSIYKWSGADTETFLSLGGTQTVLEQSYRLPRAVHEFAKGIVSKIENRYEKKFRPRDADGLVEYVQSIEGVRIETNESTLMLVRNTYMMNKIVQFLHTQGLPYIGRSGYSSVQRGHLTAIVACESLRARRTITGKQLKALAECLRVGTYLERGYKVKISLVSDKDEFTYEQVNQFGIRELPVWDEALEGILYNTRMYYRTILANGYKLSEQPKLRLSTIHGIKGGEADHVIVYSDMANKSFEEYKRTPDSERRVAYVAVTRSKERLSIIHPYTKKFFDYRAESYE